MKYYILGGLIAALVVVAYYWISEPTKTNEIYTVDTGPFIQTFTKTNEIDFGTSTVYVLNVSNLTKDYTNLFQLQIDGVPIVTVKPNGDVIYDTNNVSEATRIFWREMTYQARKVTERIGK